MGGWVLLGSFFGVLVLLVPLALVLGLVVLLALRGEPDDGARSFSLYAVLATFLGFFTLLVAVTAMSAAFTELVANDDDDGAFFEYESNDVGSTTETTFDFGDDSFGSSGGFQAPEPILPSSAGQDEDDRSWTTVIQTLIAAAAALVVLRFHWPRLEAIRRSGTAAARKVHQAYCYSVCFVVVVTLLVSVSVATFNLVQAAAPGTTGAANRGDPLESFVPLLVLSVGAMALFRIHWTRVDEPAFLRPPPEPGEPAV